MKNLAKTAFGFLISIACLWLMLQKVSLPELASRFAAIHWVFVLAAVASLAVSYAVRIFRWKVMLASGDVKVHFVDCVFPFLAAIATNNLLPLRTGDVLRALVFPLSIGIGRVLSVTSLLLERGLDILVLCVAVLIGLAVTASFQYPAWVFPTVLVLSLGLVFGFLLVVLFFIRYCSLRE